MSWPEELRKMERKLLLLFENGLYLPRYGGGSHWHAQRSGIKSFEWKNEGLSPDQEGTSQIYAGEIKLNIIVDILSDKICTLLSVQQVGKFQGGWSRLRSRPRHGSKPSTGILPQGHRGVQDGKVNEKLSTQLGKVQNIWNESIKWMQLSPGTTKLWRISTKLGRWSRTIKNLN